MQIDPALFMLEGQRKLMARNLEHLGHLIATGSRIAWQDDQYHVFLPDGNGYASGKTMWDLVMNIRDTE